VSAVINLTFPSRFAANISTTGPATLNYGQVKEQASPSEWRGRLLGLSGWRDLDSCVPDGLGYDVSLLGQCSGSGSGSIEGRIKSTSFHQVE